MKFFERFFGPSAEEIEKRKKLKAEVDAKVRWLPKNVHKADNDPPRSRAARYQRSSEIEKLKLGFSWLFSLVSYVLLYYIPVSSFTNSGHEEAVSP